MLKLEQSNINIGNVQKGTSKTFSVKITNTSTKPINSISTKVSCGSCTIASLQKHNLNPGESQTMTVTFTPTSTAVTTTKYVTVYSKCPDHIQSSIQFSFTARVI